MRRFLLRYEFGLREIETKVTILRDEFVHMHDYNPIEHISSRVKSVESIFAKLARRGLSPVSTPSATTSPTSPASGSPAALPRTPTDSSTS